MSDTMPVRRSGLGDTFKRLIRSLTMPNNAVSGQMRMVWGADTPPELQSYGILVAMLSYVTDVNTGVERGYFFQGVTNHIDGPAPGFRAMVFGNVTYPVPGDPTSATVADVKTNFQQDMFAGGEPRLTIFKDHSVRLFPGLGILMDNAAATITSPVCVANNFIELAVGPVGNTASLVFVDYPGPQDLTITKQYSAALSNLEVTIIATCYTTAPGGDGVIFGVRENAVDYTTTCITRQSNTLLNNHRDVAGGVTIPGIGAGQKTLRLRWKTQAGSDIRVDNGDALMYRVKEVPVVTP